MTQKPVRTSWIGFTQYDVDYKVFTEESDLSWTNNGTGSIYSTTGFYISFHRKIYSSLFNMFLPSLLIVCTSFVRSDLVSDKKSR